MISRGDLTGLRASKSLFAVLLQKITKIIQIPTCPISYGFYGTLWPWARGPEVKRVIARGDLTGLHAPKSLFAVLLQKYTKTNQVVEKHDLSISYWFLQHTVAVSFSCSGQEVHPKSRFCWAVWAQTTVRRFASRAFKRL